MKLLKLQLKNKMLLKITTRQLPVVKIGYRNRTIYATMYMIIVTIFLTGNFLTQKISQQN